jgi:hypothetical protein
MERGFEIKTLPYLPELHAWLDHVEICALCRPVNERLGTGEEVPVTDFCVGGMEIFIAYMNAIDHQHIASLLN